MSAHRRCVPEVTIIVSCPGAELVNMSITGDTGFESIKEVIEAWLCERSLVKVELAVEALELLKWSWKKAEALNQNQNTEPETVLVKLLVEVQSSCHRRPGHFGETSIMRCLPRIAAAIEWNMPVSRRQALCIVEGGACEVPQALWRYPEDLSESQILSFEWYTLFGFALI